MVCTGFFFLMMSKRDRRRANVFDPANNNDLANYWLNNNEETMDGNDMSDEEVNEMLQSSSQMFP